MAAQAHAAILRPSGEPTAADQAPQGAESRVLCPASALSAREVALLLELGDDAERADLLDALDCVSDPAPLEAVITWYLNHDAFDAAAYWVESADAKGLTVQPWQRMRLALYRDDREMLARLLRESGSDLPPVSRIEGLRALGENAQALVLARDQAARTRDPVERERMESLTRALARAEAPSAEAGLTFLDYGPLSIGTLEANAELPVEGHRIGFRFRASELDSSSPETLDLGDLDREQDLQVSARRAYGWGELSVRAGANVRSDGTVPYGSLDLQRPLRGDWLRQMQFGLALNGPTDETAICRVFCTKSRVSAGIAGGFSPQDFFNLSAETARYQTRENEALATGFKLDGALGYVFLQELPRWDVSLRGVFQDNDLVSRLPDSLAAVQSDPVEMEDILPTEYRFLGLGTSLQGGDATSAPGRFQYAIDAHGGWQWPTDEPSYGLRMRLATAWPSLRDSLAFSLIYANSLAGSEDDSYSQISLDYGRDFY